MDNALQELSNSEKILIYGAVKIAREAALLIEYLFPGKLIGFAVTSMVGNMDNIYGLSVKSIEEYLELAGKENVCVVIAMRDKFLGVVEHDLRNYGFDNILLMGETVGIRELLENTALSKAKQFGTVEELKNVLIKKTLSKALEEMRK